MSEFKSVGNVDLSGNELNIKWTISDAKNVLNKKKVNEYILSPPILEDKLKWFISLYPKGMPKEYNFMKVFLGIFQESNEDDSNYQINFEFSILNENGEKIFKNKILHGDYHLVKTEKFSEFSNGFYCGRGSKTFLPVADLENYLTPDKSLIINCKIEKKFDCLKIGRTINVNSVDKKEPNDCNNFKAFLEDTKFSDLELIIGDKKYLAHKVVLASKSPIFLNILEGNEKNKKQILEIKGISDDSVVEVLRFIYTNEVENMNQVAPELLAAADKYDIRGLKKLCEEDLENKITVENAIDILILAETYCAENLKIKAINLIAENMHQLNNSENWYKLNPNLMTQIVDVLIKQK